MVGQLILGLSILVSLHEFGHFITAKWFKMRVERFYLFFDFLFPIPSLLNFALFKKKIGDTEYGLGWFPLGGYVSIAGMIDETQDAKDLAPEPQPWEFRAKPAWQRLIVMLGGIIVNVILGVIIFVSLSKKNGDNYTSMDSVNKRGIVAYELGQFAGFKTGDKIIKINGKPIVKFEDVRSSEVLFADKTVYTVIRDGAETSFQLPKGFLNKLADNKSEFIDPVFHFKIKQVAPSLQDGDNKEDAISPAQKAGLKPDDKIVAVDGKATEYYHEFKEALALNKGKQVSMVIDRQAKLDTVSIKISESGKIGIAPEITDKDLMPVHRDLSFAEAFKAGSAKAFGVISDNIKGFGKIFSGQVRADKALSGPIEIAQMYGSVWDWDRFWTLTGLLSMALAFMNILPIPALDGGHAVFLIYEMIVGRAPSEKFMERAQAVGTFILLGLMIFVIGNGIFKTLH